ncbi:hypothetical protein ACWD25_20045 [Streptomyces sp. NPDC002920]
MGAGPRTPALDSPLRGILPALGRRSPSFDIAFPQQVRLRRWPEGHPFNHRPVPVLHTVGWYDNGAPWHWRDMEELTRRPDWANQQYLLIDAIDHVDESTDHALSEDAFRALLPGYLDPALDFFHIFLRRQGSPADLPRVRWYLVHGGEDGFRTAAVWPPADNRTLTLFLSPDQDTADGDTPGALVPVEPEEHTTADWTHDPEDPVPSAAPHAFAYLQTNPRLHS